jgi:hypothetical protein
LLQEKVKVEIARDIVWARYLDQRCLLLHARPFEGMFPDLNDRLDTNLMHDASVEDDVNHLCYSDN